MNDAYVYRVEGVAAGRPLVFAFRGTGGTEAQFVPLVPELMPGAVIVAPRGDVSEHGALRFFRRRGEGVYDMEDLAARTAKMAGFVAAQVAAAAPSRVIGLGYSNGANFAAALMLLNPGLIARAILLRPMLVLESPPTPDLSNTRILTITGGSDPYGGYAPELNEHLRRCGAGVAAETIAAGHGLDRQDIVLARAWHEKPD